PILLEGLKEKNLNLRRLSAAVLAQIEPVPQAAVPALQAALKDQDLTVRVTVAAALCRVPGQVKETVAVLVSALTNRALRSGAVAALAEAGAQAKEAIPALLVALQDENSDSVFAGSIGSALEQIGGAEGVAARVRTFAAAAKKSRTQTIPTIEQTDS